MYLYIAIILYFGAMTLWPWILWPSQRNTRVFMGMPFTFIAYFFGASYFIEMVRMNNYPSEDIFELYTMLLLASTVLFVVCFSCGYFHRGWVLQKVNHLLDFFKESRMDYIMRQSHWIACVAVMMFLISFYGMGFIPAFAENPLVAKFGAGEYHEQYQSFAVFYRMGLNLAGVAIVLLLLRWGLGEKKYTSIILLVLVFLCATLSLRRSLIASGLLIVMFSYMALQSRTKFVFFFILYSMIYSLGSAGNEIFFYLIGLQDSVDIASVFRGAPDLADQLLFLGSWVDGRWDYTYGLTWVGGLIPYNFDYNISAYSLKVIGAQAGETPSGGFRLPTPIVGYISFDWIGMAIFVSLSAYLDGVMLRAMQYHLQNASIKKFMVLNVFFLPILSSAMQSTVLGFSMDQMFIIIFVFSLCIAARRCIPES